MVLKLVLIPSSKSMLVLPPWRPSFLYVPSLPSFSSVWLIYYLNFHAAQCDAKASHGDSKKMTIAEREAWGTHFSDISANLDPMFPLFVFCDANSTMGSVVNQHVSSHGSAPDNVNSPFCAAFLGSNGLVLPATFQEFHIGSNHTYTPSLTDRKRIDYVANPSSVPVWNLTSSVLLIISSIIKADHWSPSVSFDVTLYECTAPLCSHRIAACERQKLSDPESVTISDNLCDDFKYNPSANVLSQCNDVTSQIRSACSEAFLFSGPTPHDSWLIPHTRRLINSAKRIRRARGNLGMRIKSL